MSQGVPSGLEGQIDSPNSLELWWENNKRILIGVGIAFVAFIAIKYGLQYLNQRTKDSKWSGVAAAANLDASYAEGVDVSGEPQEMFRKMLRRQQALVDELYTDLAAADAVEFDKKLEAARGDKTLEPILLWLAAHRAVADQDYAAARTHLEALKANHPDHFLVVASDYPPQWRTKLDPEAKTKPNRAPELVAAEPGSSIDRMLVRIDAEEAFRAANPRSYDAPTPDSDKIAVIEFESEDGSGFDDQIKIRFYASAAPKHYEAFVRLATSGFFDGIRVHHVEREGATPSRFGGIPSEFRFGQPLTREETDVSKWTAANFGQPDEENTVEWESNDISHFPGSLAAQPAKGGKSQVERLTINGDDVARDKDGSRVVFGRVIEGLEFVQRLIRDVEFSSESADQVGRGVPGDRVRIKSVTIQDA